MHDDFRTHTDDQLSEAINLTDKIDAMCDELERLSAQRAAYLAGAHRSGQSFDALAYRLRLSRETVRQIVRRYDEGRGQSGRSLRPAR